MRFVFNFIFFGLLFYVIWRFFPDAFTTLVDWAGAVFNFIYNLIEGAIQSIRGHGSSTTTAPAASEAYWRA